MMNHFHLLVMEKDWKIAEVIKSLASSYVYYYNKKNEPCDANCVDVDNTRRLQDSEVRDFIIEQCGAKSVAEFQRLTMEEQKRQMKQSLEVYIQGVKDEMRAEERMK